MIKYRIPVPVELEYVFSVLAENIEEAITLVTELSRGQDPKRVDIADTRVLYVDSTSYKAKSISSFSALYSNTSIVTEEDKKFLQEREK